MYYIDAVSFVVATNEVINDGLNATLKSNSVLPASKSCIPEINLKEFANSATETPTELGVRAAKEVCNYLSLNLEEVELIIGESATPLQVTPSEGQRISGALGIKTKVFDINSGSSSFGAFLDYISNLGEDAPKKTLWVSTNTPTRLSSVNDRNKLSDCGACVSLNKENGAYKIANLSYKNDFSIPQIVSVNTYIELSYNDENIKPFYEAIKKELKDSISKLKNKNEARFILPNFSTDLVKSVASEFQISESQLELGAQADSFGSSFAESLSSLIKKDSKVNEILIIQAGAGYGIASIILERN